MLIIGGGLVGLETADFLGERGFDVSLVEAKGEISSDISQEHKIYLMKNYQENNVELYLNYPVKEIKKDGVIITNQEELLGFDSVILALGATKYQPFDLSNIKEVYTIGDALGARNALVATREARELIEKI